MVILVVIGTVNECSININHTCTCCLPCLFLWITRLQYAKTSLDFQQSKNLISFFFGIWMVRTIIGGMHMCYYGLLLCNAKMLHKASPISPFIEKQEYAFIAATAYYLRCTFRATLWLRLSIINPTIYFSTSLHNLGHWKQNQCIYLCLAVLLSSPSHLIHPSSSHVMLSLSTTWPSPYPSWPLCCSTPLVD